MFKDEAKASRNIINQTIQERNNPLDVQLILNQKKITEQVMVSGQHSQTAEVDKNTDDPSSRMDHVHDLAQTKPNKHFNVVENPSELSSIGTFHVQKNQPKGLNLKNFESKKFNHSGTKKSVHDSNHNLPIKAIKILPDMAPTLMVNQLRNQHQGNLNTQSN